MGFKTHIIIIIVSVLLTSCLKEKEIPHQHSYLDLEFPSILKLNGKECMYDQEFNMLRYSIEEGPILNDFAPLVEFDDYYSVYFEGKKLVNNSANELDPIAFNKTYELKIVSVEKSINYNLSFTNLPIVQLIKNNEVTEKPNTLAKLIVNPPQINIQSSEYHTSIKYRGSNALQFDKKPYGLSLTNGKYLKTNSSSSILKMKGNNKWILDAMWIDKSRLRNKFAFDLWNSFNGIENHAIQSTFVEVFMNNKHMGLFNFNHNINAELLGLNENDVLYKGSGWNATRFYDYTKNPTNYYYWEGFVQKYPEPEHKLNWNPIETLVKLCVEANEHTFKKKIGDIIEINNFIDYYILLNLLSMDDNNGKNTFYKKKENGKITIIPWDMDGTNGIYWNGKLKGTDGLITNNLFTRLIQTNPDSYKKKLTTRWNELRVETLSYDNLVSHLNTISNPIQQSNIISLENKIWNTDIEHENEIQHINQWLFDRLVFLDQYFNSL